MSKTPYVLRVMGKRICCLVLLMLSICSSFAYDVEVDGIYYNKLVSDEVSSLTISVLANATSATTALVSLSFKGNVTGSGRYKLFYGEGDNLDQQLTGEFTINRADVAETKYVGLSNLKPNQKYSVQLVAGYDDALNVSSDIETFQTPAKTLKITSVSASNITAKAATILIQLSANSVESVSYEVKYSKNEDMTDALKKEGNILLETTNGETISVGIDQLEEQTTYYYQVTVCYTTDTSLSDTKSDSFKTPEKVTYVVPEKVDLGCSVLWGSFNLGAKDKTSKGGFFGWGDPTGEKISQNESYGNAGLTPPVDLTTSHQELDIVHVTLGDKWHTPTAAQMLELLEKCTWTHFTNYKGVSGLDGYEVRGKGQYAENSIFIPHSGCRTGVDNDGNIIYSANSNEAYYWSSQLTDSPWGYGVFVKLQKGTVKSEKALTFYGMHIRPVYDGEGSTTCSLIISTLGHGTTSYDGNDIRNSTASFTVNAGISVPITITPDDGYRIKSVKENNTNVTSYVLNGTYTINSISRDTNVEVEFEADSPKITFADANVKAICVANWDTNGDGELSEQEAAAVKDIGTVFKEKTTIKIFDEFKYFTGIKAIPNNAFESCSGLTSITIPNSVTSIGSHAFYMCSGLTSVTIGNSVTSIGYLAFSYCSGLTSVTIPNSVTSIGDYAFSECRGLTSVNIFDIAAWCKIAFSNSSSNPLCFANHLYLNGEEIKDLVIPNSVTSIGDLAFSYCSGLTSVTIGNSVTSIGDLAFEYCSGLTSVTIGNSVTSIGDWAFSYCSGLTSVNIFDIAAWCKIVFLDNQSNPLFYAHHLYLNGEEITDLVIPNSVTSIGSYAFSGCSGLTSITIPNSVTSIGDGAFSWCRGLISVISEIQNPFQIDESVFTQISYEAILQVPQGTKSKYEALYGWATNFKEIIEDNTLVVSATIETGTPDVDYTSAVIPVKVSSDSVIEIASYGVRYSIHADMSSATLVKGNGQLSANTFKNVLIEDLQPGTTYYYQAFADLTTPALTLLSEPIASFTTRTKPCSLWITASGNGSAIYNGTSVRNNTYTFTVNGGASATISFKPDNGYYLNTVLMNGTDVSSQVSGNQYTISNITANTTLEVTFVEIVSALSVDGINYTVESVLNKTVNVAAGNYGQVLTVPASITANGYTWTVMGIETDALSGNKELAAVIWNPYATFNAKVSNPNLLLYVKAEQYAPSLIQNVVVSGNAKKIVLKEAQSGNNFYCPQAFTAQQISYTHNYQMQTGIGESKGWETIALPFDVQTFIHETKGSIVPFAQWKSGDAEKPFWLYELTGGGFVETGSLKAYTPYIISMPNNPRYDSQWLLNGKVTFAASGVTVGKTENLNYSVFNGRTFTPCFTDMDSDMAVYSLNVNNDYETNNSGMTEGSMFVWKLRHIHPFEAYMTNPSSAPVYAFGVFDGMSTSIKNFEHSTLNIEHYYDLQGRRVETPSKKGVYIVNGKKKIIK